jgi:Uma2 family endonuclease
MRVQADDNSKAFNKFKPDVVARRGPPGTGAYITDPVVVVEVLSPSTMDNDRGPKLRFYKALPRVQRIVLVYSDQMRAEHYWRMEEGWRFEALTAPEQTFALEAVDFRMELAQVYFDLASRGAWTRGALAADRCSP